MCLNNYIHESVKSKLHPAFAWQPHTQRNPGLNMHQKHSVTAEHLDGKPHIKKEWTVLVKTNWQATGSFNRLCSILKSLEDSVATWRCFFKIGNCSSKIIPFIPISIAHLAFHPPASLHCPFPPLPLFFHSRMSNLVCFAVVTALYFKEEIHN